MLVSQNAVARAYVKNEAGTPSFNHMHVTLSMRTLKQLFIFLSDYRENKTNARICNWLTRVHISFNFFYTNYQDIKQLVMFNKLTTSFTQVWILSARFSETRQAEIKRGANFLGK